MKNELNDNNVDLSKIVGQTSTGTFGGYNSSTREDMATNSHIKHSVPPAFGAESPLIDSTYSQRYLYSTENIKMNKITYLHKAVKIIDGVITRTAYFFYNHDTNLVDLEIVDNYSNSYLFAYEKTSQLENHNIGDTLENVYISYYKHYDPKYSETKFGRNLNVLYNLGCEDLEDGIYISKEASEKMTINHFYDIKFTLSKNQILRNIYSKDKNIYQPIPRVGQEIENDTVASIINNATNIGILFMTNDTDTQDIRYLVHGGHVVDIEVISEVAQEIEQLEIYRLANLEFYKEITKVLEEFNTKYKLSPSAMYIKENNIYKLNSYRIKIKELKKSTYVNIKVVYPKAPEAGYKITNRHGGKGVISGIMTEDIVVEDGAKIDLMINVTGISNRENIGQKYEHDISALNVFLMKYLKESKDNYNTKFNNIIKWLEIATLHETVKSIKTLFKTNKEIKEYVDYYTINPLTLKFAPFPKYHTKDPNSIFNFERFLYLRDFTKSLYPKMAPFKIYEGGRLWTNRIDGTQTRGTHYYGKVFYIALENSPVKETQIRSEGIYNNKGYVSKKGEDKKSHQSKWGTTGNKMSDLVTNIILNVTLPERYELIEKSMKILNDYTTPLGFYFRTIYTNERR